MPKSEMHEIDTPEEIGDCLNCPYPNECCLGEKHCKALGRAENRAERRTERDCIRYAFRKGMTPAQIAREFGRHISFVQQVLTWRFADDPATFSPIERGGR